MTVKELLEKLKDANPDALVERTIESAGGNRVGVPVNEVTESDGVVLLS